MSGSATVPQTAREALHGHDASRWAEAMEKELSNIESKKTWEETVLPVGRRAIDSRWVFAIKHDADGNVIKYKARLVAKGFSQQPGIDFEETYAPVSRMVSLRLLLTIAAAYDLELHQADVEGAYLNGKLQEEIYMRYPEAMVRKPGCDVLRLKGSLYGLKQSARVWWIELGNALSKNGFVRLESDWGMYYKPSDGQQGPIIVLAYVDDLVIAARNKTTITKLMSYLKSKWTMTEVGEMSQILGLKVVRDRTRKIIHLSQPAYIESVAKRFTAAPRSYTTPLPTRPETVLVNSNVLDTSTGYLQVIGCLMWMAGATRPDICYAVRYLARSSAQPTQAHYDLALRVISYATHSKDLGLVLGGAIHGLEGWVDADYAGCTETRRSTTGYLFKFCHSTIQWQSRRQATVAQSTLDAEYTATAEAAREATWLRTLLSELGMRQGCTILHCDNQGAILLASNPGTHARSKHIDVKHHYIRNKVHDGELKLEYVQSELQNADFLTKILSR
ncbi:hypothetical protein TREMEDRAFT_26944, partial [Tremella mesenterica DSM 1558]|uniref:uncharacterized protein n=1 Tax=Tremella mesenterica (strain ATCC 24925 / CBS 8224 / DSM 1558 / NBRC 9311 / NRRL Y-6157 / RJB 2259-6 / UBC 559-6) TaxID=578456 RepID=UPI0003F4A5D4